MADGKPGLINSSPACFRATLASTWISAAFELTMNPTIYPD